MSHTTPFDRRTLLAAAGTGAAVTALRPARANANSTTGLRVKEQLLFVDRHKLQRFLWQSTKPPVYVQGRTFPAEARGGPPEGSYFIFNDEDQNEKGGITVSRNGATMGLDYPNVQAITFGTGYEGKDGASQLAMVEMPDPDIPIEELTREDVPLRVLLGTSNVGDGALLFLYDHAGRPRITLHVPDTGDAPTIRVLDENGGVVAQLPPEAPAAASRARRSMLPFGALGRWFGR